LIFRLNDGPGPELLRHVFLERGWQEFDEDEHDEQDWNLWWRSSRFRNSDYEQLQGWQRLNHHPKCTAITKKDALARNMKRMKAVHGAGIYNFSPMAFNLPNDYTKFVGHCSKLKEKDPYRQFTWICKPADLSRGRGIFLFKDLSELQYDCNAVVQQYISNPLLISGYKFDLRIYVLVPSFHPLVVYIYDEGLARFGTEKFDLGDIGNMFAHLTNTSINKHSPNYIVDKERVGPGCKWTLAQLRSYLRQINVDDRLIFSRIVNVVLLTLFTQVDLAPKSYNCFELYGFDIMVDENFKPWLLEVNFSPSLTSDCQVDLIVKKPMLHDLIDILQFTEQDKQLSDNQPAHLTRSTGRTIPPRYNIFDKNVPPRKKLYAGYPLKVASAPDRLKKDHYGSKSSSIRSESPADSTPGLTRRKLPSESNIHDVEKRRRKKKKPPHWSANPLNKRSSLNQISPNPQSYTKPWERPRPRVRHSGHPRAPPVYSSRVGDFFLAFPFNDVTKKYSEGKLDVKVVIQECQKL
ncbi:hypothetical protein CAPTEDRAFT_72974, partial [Capitella teleta]